MKLPTFAAQRDAWSSPPVDDVGYIPSSELLAMSDAVFAQTITTAITARYTGWRNRRERWTRIMGLYDTVNARILDYGCGIGIEALQYTTNPNRIWLADIVADNLKVAERTFAITPDSPLEGTLLISGRKPFLTPPEPLDVVHCSGVLHHIPNAREVVEEMHGWLVDGGQLRLMLYSNVAWQKAVGEPPRRDLPSHEHPAFMRFVRHWDAVGGYADWYDREKLSDMFGDLFNVVQYQALTQDGSYVGARLVKR